MLGRGTRSPSLAALLVVALVTLFLYYQRDAIRASRWPGILQSGDLELLSTNATLGFGGLWAVSGLGSQRRNHLEQAAHVTGLDLSIPPLPAWTAQDVENFRWHNKSESQIRSGTVKAWLSHHKVLQAFLESGQETALVMEDDVDWDIRLRTKQIPLAQQAVRHMSRSTFDPEQYPWGLPRDWDLLYLGHCGDYLDDIMHGVGVGHNHPSQLEALPHLMYQDPTMLYRTDLHPYTASLLTAFVMPEQTRLLHKSVWPLCTFGYAVTRRTAQRLLTELTPPHEDPSKHLTAYDAAILTACRDGMLNCYTLTPELFHHMEGESMIAGEEAKERIVVRPPVDEAGLEQVQYRHETSNIGCGFASGEFYYENDGDKFAFVKDEIIAKGRCLKAGRDS